VAEEVLLSSGDIVITPYIARFGGVSYQMANIGSVTVFIGSRWRALTKFLLFIAAVAALVGYLNDDPVKIKDSYRFAMFIAAGGIIWQLMFWRRKLTLVLRTSSGDIQAYNTFDRQLIFKIKEAIETGFAYRS
jgi:hypothetical protein